MKTSLASFLFLPFAAIAADTNALPALAPAYGKLPPTFWEQHQTAIVIGGFLLILAQSLFLWKMLMRLQPSVEPPENLARAALNRLLDEPEDGKLLSEVSQILRRHIGAAFQMRGAELTTSEFTAEILPHEKIGQELAGKISDFLRECDARKFAPEKNTAALDAVERALDFITQLEARRAASAPTR
jgi:hypothetical protein